jgi:hypothetical protein
MALRPTQVFEGLGAALHFNIYDLVERPCRSLVILDHERAKCDGFAAVPIVDRAARLPMHPRGALKLPIRAVAGLSPDDRAQLVENLPLR